MEEQVRSPECGPLGALLAGDPKWGALARR
jgi:hypothetical protein